MASPAQLWTPQPVDSVAALLRRIEEIRIDLAAKGHVAAWRGQADADWPVRSTLDRRLDDFVSPLEYSSCIALEREMLEGFRTRAFEFASDNEQLYLRSIDGDAVWNVMALGRHARLPTRVVDWTWSPAVAAYFACMEHPDSDAALWWFDQMDLQDLLGEQWDNWGVPTRANAFEVKGLSPLDEARLGLNQRVLSATAFEPHGAPWLTKIHFAFMFPRMETQRGFMTACGRLRISHNEVIDRLAALRPIRRETLVIPAALKGELLVRLRDMGVHATSLNYPGVDIAAREIGDRLR